MTNLQLATFGGGCFWCTEAVFLEVKGIKKVVSGYSGGNAPGKPTYREICSGLTGHAEVIQVTYDENIISYESVLIIFMTTHDPTQLNRQGADVGTQYRSVIYYHNEYQEKIAHTVINALTPVYQVKIVTEISPLSIFYEAEEEHQAYYKNNPSAGYCTLCDSSKIAKIKSNARR